HHLADGADLFAAVAGEHLVADLDERKLVGGHGLGSMPRRGGGGAAGGPGGGRARSCAILRRGGGEARRGPFAIERELGRGGMGVVYAARHEGKKVALKVSIDDLSERDRKHFLAEAELLSRISHPAVIEILDSGAFEDGRPYLVMPLLEGE